MDLRSRQKLLLRRQLVTITQMMTILTTMPRMNSKMITTKVIRGDSLMEMTKISKIMTLSSEEKEVLTLVLSSTGGKDIMMTNTAMMIKSKLTTARGSSTSSTKS